MQQTTIINNLPSYIQTNIPLTRTISTALHLTHNFIKMNPDLLFPRADKGNITVALNKNDYIFKVNNILQDKETYIEVKKDPTKSVNNNVCLLLARWKNNNLISQNNYKQLYHSDSLLPRAYGLPKIHKVGIPYRIIISTINTPFYPLASYLQDLISRSIPKPPSFVENSFHLFQQLNGACLDGDEFSLISLDVIYLFSNIPLDLAINSLSKRWNYISKHCTITQEEFFKAIKIIFDSTFFSFNNKYYKQKFGTPMGFPLSPVIADIVLQNLEAEALKRFGVEVPFYLRYVP